ncbi:hypothetical protein UAW_00643 [Enterococcus haemoperoxidus ATCC BAA-382]|uniref:Uncharacterized protein n=1 Tax=Enterococcus haemoperoxidus ATCC BAA-382 TaxID=1158608 RepID=R2T3D1_9ENTE|nr:hypothetical protein [Enterococcus haemoperoxidus]EOH99491.1 hypothetical protein UAW_00643 [Enterococcus haemoperoxidus ATCC BAA-382]EOT62769.1 hypothetical protein I583_01770 [Enterococcus haemoperoxidus ATCC BAA-382]OJG55238.1 hypothetical protein RV06_GL002275 [Enterococcus haemoperoxidus]
MIEAIVVKEFPCGYFTNMKYIFEAIKKDNQYNWLITDYECNYYPDDLIKPNEDYIWLDNENLMRIVENNDIQFIWGVFSGFPKNISKKKILENNLPYANGYIGFWSHETNIQHPLAEVELVSWDSSLFLAISKNKKIITDIQQKFLHTESLKEYIDK